MRRQFGYTLLEAALVVAVLGILLLIAFPEYRRVVTERRVQNVTREIVAALRVAQQAATAKSAGARCTGLAFEERRVRVYVVPHDAPFDCDNPFATGLRAYGVLLTSRDYPAGVTVKPSVGGNAVAFLPSGERRPGDPSVVEAVVSGGEYSRTVCVNAAGLVWVPLPGDPCTTP